MILMKNIVASRSVLGQLAQIVSLSHVDLKYCLCNASIFNQINNLFPQTINTPLCFNRVAYIIHYPYRLSRSVATIY